MPPARRAIPRTPLRLALTIAPPYQRRCPVRRGAEAGAPGERGAVGGGARRWHGVECAKPSIPPEERSEEMVRSVAERAYLPTRNLLEEIGDMMILTARTITSALRPPYPYGGEFVSQFLFALRLCWFPLLISTVAIDYAAPGLQAANFLTIFGALDRLGGFFVLGAIREIGPSVTAIVVAGVAGTAITGELRGRQGGGEVGRAQGR